TPYPRPEPESGEAERCSRAKRQELLLPSFPPKSGERRGRAKRRRHERGRIGGTREGAREAAALARAIEGAPPMRRRSRRIWEGPAARRRRSRRGRTG